MNPEPQHLILFTRYPLPGTAKTRLIPVLGEVGAAELSRHMTEHTLAQVQALQQQQTLTMEICFAGDSVACMQAWLGQEYAYTSQGEGDLGDRLARSLQAAFATGAAQVVIIGSDCPELNPALLQQAFVALDQHDLVLGPALDGGYYLIGLRRFVPELFVEIAWSTAEVCAQTLAIARQLNLDVFLLPPLADVDYPEDLVIWQRVTAASPNMI
ncbi:MAG: TIGR04282 family arsenosugar biosynthesis glycosyltransferase [Leptolyngbyaceae cyanobacterium bins.349]|nr:TIGR04282 family arsenosugar biosynthesis glycosyltransferase [Leptolyngbyaceae cyanobacterium bins.349]